MNSWHDLIELLREEEGLCQEFLNLLQEERLLMNNPSVDDIYKRVNEKEILSLRFKIMEESRLRLVENIVKAENPELLSQELTLRQLLELAPAPYKGMLQQCHANLLSLSSSMKEINRENKSLITQSLDIIKESLSVIFGALGPEVKETTYTTSGKIKTGGSKRRTTLGTV